MENNNYFKEALSDFAFDAANGGVIRHLAGKGCTVKQIMEELDIWATYEKVQQAVWDFLLKERIILLEEPGSTRPKEKEIYIKEHGKFGKTSFRRVLIPEEQSQMIHWNEIRYGKSAVEEFEKLISEKCIKNGRNMAYVSCDFGILKKESQKRYEELLSMLEERQKEYVEGLPWVAQRVYHRMDFRMSEVACRLMYQKDYKICCYFMELGEKIILE